MSHVGAVARSPPPTVAESTGSADSILSEAPNRSAVRRSRSLMVTSGDRAGTELASSTWAGLSTTGASVATVCGGVSRTGSGRAQPKAAIEPTIAARHDRVVDGLNININEYGSEDSARGEVVAEDAIGGVQD